jgi:hypothetical protein
VRTFGESRAVFCFIIGHSLQLASAGAAVLNIKMTISALIVSHMATFFALPAVRDNHHGPEASSTTAPIRFL